MRWALRGAVLALGLALVLVSFTTWSVFRKERAAAAARSAAAAEHADLVARKTALEANLEALDTPRGIEAAIRARYPVVKPGEEVITLVDAPPAAATTTPSPPGIWDSVKNWLGW